MRQLDDHDEHSEMAEEYDFAGGGRGKYASRYAEGVTVRAGRRRLILNVHRRKLDALPGQVGSLLDSLSSAEDVLWPRRLWPRMVFDRPLQVGAVGGHGPIRYSVESYVPGRSVQFRFTGPRGFDGFHGFDVVGTQPPVVLRHTLEMTTRGPARITWPLIFRPLHDALIEDALDQAQTSLGLSPPPRRWSAWVRLLRWAISRGRGRRK